MKSKNLIIGLLAGATIVSTAAFFFMRHRKNHQPEKESKFAKPSRGERLAAKAKYKAQHHYTPTTE